MSTQAYRGAAPACSSGVRSLVTKPCGDPMLNVNFIVYGLASEAGMAPDGPPALRPTCTNLQKVHETISAHLDDPSSSIKGGRLKRSLGERGQ